MKTLSTFSICLLMAALGRAEHRVALLIDNSRHENAELAIDSVDLSTVQRALEQEGFRCEVVEKLDEKGLREAIEQFANRTPTRGTALVYFRGRVVDGSYNGNEAVCLVGVRSNADRGYSLEVAFAELVSRGGSLRNIALLDGVIDAKREVELAAQCHLVRATADSPADRSIGHMNLPPTASRAISPPDKLITGSKPGDEWVDHRGMIFCWCPPGKYLAGSPSDTPGRYPDEDHRQVTITDGFWISKYELTLSQNPRNTPRDTIASDKNHPVTMIHHDDGRSITRTLTEASRKRGDLPTGWEYSLPTEEQWEYAARAGTSTHYSFGNDANQLPNYGNFGDRSYYETGDIFSNAANRKLDDGTAYLANVGSYQPNAWGLYDIHGNVAEWCLNQAIRGGSWASTAENCRSAYRDHFSSRNEQNFIGYRLVIQPIAK